MITFDPFNYRCDSGACPVVETVGGTTFISEL